jgi:hypothetical protein
VVLVSFALKIVALLIPPTSASINNDSCRNPPGFGSEVLSRLYKYKNGGVHSLSASCGISTGQVIYLCHIFGACIYEDAMADCSLL